MGKKLSEMTLEELWALFPIFLTEHKREWAGWFDEEKGRLQSVLPADEIVSVSHIGSTAVSTIWAKPIIDILIEVRPGCRLDDIRPRPEIHPSCQRRIPGPIRPRRCRTIALHI